MPDFSPRHRALKDELWSLIKLSSEDPSDDVLPAMRAIVDELIPYSPIARPVDQQDQIEGRWMGRFSYYGAGHSRGVKREFVSDLKTLSFGNLPKVPICHEETAQEISVKDLAYNNVTSIKSLDGLDCGHIIVLGSYVGDAENPQRYHVSFYGYRLLAPEGLDEAQYRQRLGVDADVRLSGEYKPPRLHSDIVYADDDTRINFGGLGGLYVLERVPGHPGVSVSFGG